MAQRLYEERTGAAGIRMPGQVHVPTMPVDTRGASLLGAVADAGEKIGGLLAREYAREQQTRIGERLLAARKEFAAWQEQYVQTRQGGNALTAGEDFAAKMREIADRQLAAFGGKSNEVFQRELSGQMAALTLRAQEQGAAYASGQRSLWERSVLEGQRAQLLADAERDPGNGAWLDFQLMEYGRSLAARGLDATAPMMELGSAVQLRRGLAYVQRGALGAASGLLRGWKPGGEHPGDLSARYESGADGSSAIGYDKKGGTSYGRFQLSSKKGGMDGFLRFLEGRGGEAASIAARLRAAGPADTGGKSGAMPEAWKKESQAPGFADLEREYIQRAFYEPVMRSLPSGAAAAVRASPQLGQMVWSTAVQHGATGAAGILRKVWRDGMTPEDFVRAAYTERASRFGGSEPDVRASVQRRLRREADDLLGGLSGRGGINGMSLADAARLDEAIEEKRRKDRALAHTASEGFADAAAYGSATGDFGTADAIVEEVEGLDADMGRELRSRLDVRREVFEGMRLYADRPLAEQHAAAMKAIDARLTPENARDVLSLLAEAESAVKRRMKAFTDDPAAFAAQARPELLPEGLPSVERTRRLLEAQAVLGRGLSFTPRVLSRAQAADMERAFTAGDPLERPALLAKMRADYGPYFTAAATEARLPASVVSLGAALDRLPPSRASVLLAAATAKADDIPGVNSDARASAADAVAGLDFMRGLAAMSRRFPDSEAARSLARSWEKTLTNAALMGVAPEEVAEHFEISVEADAASGGGHMLLLPQGSLPGGWDVDDLAEAAEIAREEVARRLTAELPEEGAGYATPSERRDAERALRHMATSGVWISAADGASVHLVDEVSGLPVLYGDGTPVMFGLAQLASLAEAHRRTTTKGFEGLYNRLFVRGYAD